MRFGFLFLLLIGSLNASLIGNPSDPAILEEGFWISDRCFSSVRAGVSGDFLFLKRLRPSRASKGLEISRPEMNWTLALADVGFNIRERFDLHLIAGPVASVQFHWRQHGVDFRAHSDQGMFFGGSSKLIVLEIKDTTLGVDFHGGIMQGAEGTLIENSIPERNNFSSAFHFWQLSLGVSQTIKSLRPYIGAFVNQLTTSLHSDSMKRIYFRHLERIGMAEGCSLSFGSKIFLNLEARQFSETGLSVTGEFRF